MFDKENFDFPAELHWQDSKDGILRLIFIENEPETLGARQERTALPFKWFPVTSLMTSSLRHLTVNGHSLKERESLFLKTAAAARSYNYTVVMTVCCYGIPLALQVTKLLIEICIKSRIETVGFHAQNTNSCIQLIY